MAFAASVACGRVLLVFGTIETCRALALQSAGVVGSVLTFVSFAALALQGGAAFSIPRGGMVVYRGLMTVRDRSSHESRSARR